MTPQDRKLPASGKTLIYPGVNSGTYIFSDMTPRLSGPVRIAMGGREQCGLGYKLQRPDFPFVTLEYVAEGRGLLRRAGGPALSLEPGSIYAYGPGMAHEISTDGIAMEKYFICLSGRGARKYLSDHAPVFGTPLLHPRHAELRELFDWIFREGLEHSQAIEDICLRLLDVVLLKLSPILDKSGRTEGKAHKRFLECKAYINAHAAQMNSMDEIVSALHIDPSNLCRLFRRFQGSSPYAYLIRCRMNLAASDFMSSGGLVKEVAARLGYEDPYHFSRLFKAVHGLPPAKFRSLYV